MARDSADRVPPPPSGESGTPIQRDGRAATREVPECASTARGHALAVGEGMTSRSVCSALALLSACVEAPDLATTDQGLVATSKVTSRGVNLTADMLEDWGHKKQLSQAIVANHTLKVRYCGKHFPPNSQIRANLEKAVNAYSTVAGLTIEITDVAEEPGTATNHPDLATFTYPNNAIYVDYADLDPGVYAATGEMSCDNSVPIKQCTKAKVLINDQNIGFTDPMNVDDATSVGVFMHEIGHAWGLSHINSDLDDNVLLDPSDMAFDRSTIHGWKTQAMDFRSNLIHAGTLAFLQTYYGDPADPALLTNEIVAHTNTSIRDGDTHIEWNPAKTYTWGTAASAIEELNETKLRWNNIDNTFEPCNFYGTLPRWFARMSDTSTNATNTPFESWFEVSKNTAATSWSKVGSQTFDSVGANDLRQIDWEKTFPIRLADVGLSVPPTQVVDRKLRFRADANGALTERNEANNEWSVNVCLYPVADTTCSRECLQPSSPNGGGSGEDDDSND